MSLSGPINWKVVKKGIYDWFASATGLTTIWSNEDGPRPSYPYATLQIVSGPVREGIDETRWETRGEPGEEVVDIITAGQRLLTVSCQVLIRKIDSDNDPDECAENYLGRAQATLYRESFLQPLRDAGVAVVRDLGVVLIPEVVDDSWLSRGNMDVVFRVASNLIPIDEGEGYIKAVKMTSTHNKTEDVSIDPDLEMDKDLIGEI